MTSDVHAERLQKLLEKIDHLLEDMSIPRNVRTSATEVRRVLTNPEQQDINVKKNEAISYLEDVTEDSNIPVHGRTRLWDILSDIEAL